MKCTISEKRTDFKYSPVKKKRVHHKNKKMLHVYKDQMTLYFRVSWYHDVILYECFASLENAKKPIRMAIVHKLRFGLHQKQLRALAIHSNGHTSAT